MPLFVPRTGIASALHEKQGYVGPSQKISRMMIERKAARRCRCGFPHYTTLAGELMFGNEPPKSPDALDRKPLAPTAQEFRGTLPAIVIAAKQGNPFLAEQRRMDCFVAYAPRNDVENSPIDFFKYPRGYVFVFPWRRPERLSDEATDCAFG
jgi:hypothetical protein